MLITSIGFCLSRRIDKYFTSLATEKYGEHWRNNILEKYNNIEHETGILEKSSSSTVWTGSSTIM